MEEVNVSRAEKRYGSSMEEKDMGRAQRRYEPSVEEINMGRTKKGYGHSVEEKNMGRAERRYGPSVEEITMGRAERRYGPSMEEISVGHAGKRRQGSSCEEEDVENTERNQHRALSTLAWKGRTGPAPALEADEGDRVPSDGEDTNTGSSAEEDKEETNAEYAKRKNEPQDLTTSSGSGDLKRHRGESATSATYKLNQLYTSCDGEVQALIAHCMALPAERPLEVSLDILDDHYGEERTYMDQLIGLRIGREKKGKCSQHIKDILTFVKRETKRIENARILRKKYNTEIRKTHGRKQESREDIVENYKGRAHSYGEKHDPKSQLSPRAWEVSLTTQTRPYMRPAGPGGSRYYANKCRLCGSNHPLHMCALSRSLSIEHRRSIVRTQGRCFNCLGDNHLVKDCKARPCDIDNCKGWYSRWLHETLPQNLPHIKGDEGSEQREGFQASDNKE
ncbi:hypothetical protein O3P69_017091 [Scylla paramamosain]|uniref:CCHC-type domain-containing protein n=1 Tax=Scylla paramamosain TaxID=85552 RepID=A0AAW0TVS5_SCYPA